MPRGNDLSRYRRPRLDEPSVSALLQRVGLDPNDAEDLGGTMSLNVAVPRAAALLRIHPPFVTRPRLRGLRDLRRHLAGAGLIVGTPRPIGGREAVSVGAYLAEMEAFVPHEKPPPAPASYVWMYEAMGRLHRALATAEVAVPRPVVATYGTPSSLRRLLPTTAAAAAGEEDTREIAAWIHQLVNRLARQWVPPSELTQQFVHGDIRLGNVVTSADGAPVYLDFGFAAVRPRVHDLAYSLPWIVFRPTGDGRPEDFDWGFVKELVDGYERGAGHPLSATERRALAPYVAAVPIYLAAVAGYTPDPLGILRGDVPFLRIAEWVLENGIEV